MAATGTNVGIPFNVGIPVPDDIRTHNVLTPSRVDTSMFVAGLPSPAPGLRIVEPTLPLWRLAGAMFLLHSGDDGDHKIDGSITIGGIKSAFEGVDVIDNHDYSNDVATAVVDFPTGQHGKFMCWLDTQYVEDVSSFQDPGAFLAHRVTSARNRNPRLSPVPIEFNAYGTHSGIIHAPATTIVSGARVDPSSTGSAYPFTDAPIVNGRWYFIDYKSGDNDGKWVMRCYYNISYLPLFANVDVSTPNGPGDVWGIESYLTPAQRQGPRLAQETASSGPGNAFDLSLF
jgi:hypothetical protein